MAAAAPPRRPEPSGTRPPRPGSSSPRRLPRIRQRSIPLKRIAKQAQWNAPVASQLASASQPGRCQRPQHNSIKIIKYWGGGEIKKKCVDVLLNFLCVCVCVYEFTKECSI